MTQGTKAGLAALAVFILLGIAGKIDRTEQIISHMPEKTYSEIKEKLGGKASETEIVKEYTKNYRLYEHNE